MALLKLVAGSLLFLAFVLPALGNVIRIPDPEQYLEEYPISLHEYDKEADDELDPSQMLAYIHAPNEKECEIHQFSRCMLMVTKDLISFAPRSKFPDKQLNTQQKLAMLHSLRPEDVKALLSQQSIIVPKVYNFTCEHSKQYYRTLDGSCNNPYNLCWGKADEPYLRWLPSAYANGIDEPRNRMKNGNPLPSPRLIYQWVSSQFEPSSDTTYPYMSNLAVVWGQMIAHDMVLTPTVTVKVWDGKELKEEKPHCCNTKTPHPECIPIVMNYDDGYYSQGHCMSIVRSVAYVYSPYSCTPLTLGKTREQMNQITPFLDASLLYGSSDEEMLKLRENGGYGAKLIMDYTSRWSYPMRKNSTSCKSSLNACDKNCFLTGERRANENPVLGAMHTLWAREHNRLVDLLRPKGWPENTLFHVVRKIVGALLQHTTYKEYLPQILGPTLVNGMKLDVPTEAYKYNPTTNPSIYNAFATAAFRFGHSMVSSRSLRAGRSLNDSPLQSQDFFSMDDFCNSQRDPLEVLLYGQLQQKVQKVDCLFSKQLTNHLFAKQPNGKGLDIFSLNIQRGRDHGIPPYNDWRVTCGLPKAKDYSDLTGMIPDYVLDRLEKIYGPGNVDEIDLFVGGISEFPVNDGILGPTFTCIVAYQFSNLKFGDRFWYENLDHPGALTPAQIETIQKTTIASLLCRNTEIQEMPEMALILESQINRKLPCNVILQKTDLDLSRW